MKLKTKLKELFKSKEQKRREKLLRDYEEGKILKVEGVSKNGK